MLFTEAEIRRLMLELEHTTMFNFSESGWEGSEFRLQKRWKGQAADRPTANLQAKLSIALEIVTQRGKIDALKEAMES